eukprot:m.168165 g.168165  ORF g.168165 m.168165 type:complete len:498 (-) comp15259_c0_seq1:24-1517(-)
MFADCDGVAVNVASSWSQKKATAVGSTQTSEILTDHQDTQTHSKQSIQIQTDDIEANITAVNEGEDQAPALVEFLQRAEKEVAAALASTKKSAAFDGYAVHWSDDEAEDTDRIVLTNPTYSHLQCTALGWNSRGAVVGVGYGRHDHGDWCAHQGSICTWNITRMSLNRAKPDTAVELPTCILCLQWHPEHPALLVAGGYNGIVYVIDTSQPAGKELVAECSSDENVHTEPVVQVAWRTVVDRHGKRSYLIVSASGDGSVNMWTTRPGKRELVLVRRVFVVPSDMPEHARRRSALPSSPVGVTSMAVPTDGSSSLLLGLENGTVVAYTLDAAAHVRAAPEMAHAPHTGPVYSVAYAPHHRALFLSAGSDGSLRVYHHLQVAPVLTLDCGSAFVLGAQWLPGRACAAVAVTDAGHLLVFDLKESRCAPVVKYDITEKHHSLLSVACNPKRPRTVAVGDADGRVVLVTLPRTVYTPTLQDDAVLAGLAAELTFAISNSRS